jgi:hypothetical protein
MNTLQIVTSTFLIFTNLLAAMLGLFHLPRHYIAPIAQTSSTLSRLRDVPTTTQIGAQDFPVAAGLSASATTPCDSDPNHNFCRKDSRFVYSEGYLIVGADPTTFVVLGADGNYGKDSKTVYWIIEGEEGPEPHAVIGANTTTFQILRGDEMYAKDDNNAYWSGYRIVGADSATLTSVVCATDGCEVDARDKGHTYLAGRIVATTSQP